MLNSGVERTLSEVRWSYYLVKDGVPFENNQELPTAAAGKRKTTTTDDGKSPKGFASRFLTSFYKKWPRFFWPPHSCHRASIGEAILATNHLLSDSKPKPGGGALYELRFIHDGAQAFNCLPRKNLTSSLTKTVQISSLEKEN